MHTRFFPGELPSRLASAVSRWWFGLRVSWRVADKEPWVFAFALLVLAVIFFFALKVTYRYQDERRDVLCLARNVYFEARGELIAGQYAVAEVTMNRRDSGRFPGTVCGVVYQKNWDPLRGRYVGAFSWTEFDMLPQPTGAQWLLAWEVAEDVYYRRAAPVLDRAMYFHAVYIKPDWAKSKRRLARIGGHIFYR